MGNALSISDSFLFPSSHSTYDTTLPNLIWIDENFSTNNPMISNLKNEDTFKKIDKEKECIKSAQYIRDPSREKFLFPALFFNAPSKTKFTILYWHGNSCDLGEIFEELHILSDFVNCNICAIEFPGYGLRRDINTNADLIDKWSLAAFNFLVWLGIAPKSIICFGRSIGTGAACKLAATLKEKNINIGGVILHAPYISVHKIVEEYVPMSSWLIKNYWDNLQNLSKLSPFCPLLIIHGEDDEIIPAAHGKTLIESYVSDVKDGFFPEFSSHNCYYIIDDLGEPIRSFIQKKVSNLTTETVISIPKTFYTPPKNLDNVKKATRETTIKITEDIIHENSAEKKKSGMLTAISFDKIIESSISNSPYANKIDNDFLQLPVLEDTGKN